MELIGIRDSSYKKTDIILESNNLMYESIISEIFLEHNIGSQQDYDSINSEILIQIVNKLEKYFFSLYDKEKNNLLKPDLSIINNVQLIKVAYRQEFLRLIEDKVYFFFGNATHREIQYLDNLIYKLKKGSNENKVGFIYCMDSNVDKLIRKWHAFIISNNKKDLQQVFKENEIFSKKIDVFLKNGLIKAIDNKLFYTHKFYCFFKDEINISFSNQE